MASLDTLICPTDCTSNLAEFSFSDCNPTYVASQINYVYLTNVGYPLVDWTNPAEWAARMALTTEPNAIRRLRVIGSLPLPTSTTKDVPGGIIQGPKTYVLTADIYDISDANWDAARALGCNGNYLMYFSVLGEKMFYPGTSVSVNMQPNITNSKDDYVLLTGTFTWTTKFMPLMIANPLAA